MKIFVSLIIGLLFLISNPGYSQNLKVACIGNSVTAGYLLANPRLEAYPSQLQQFLGNKYQVGNFGRSGATLLKNGHNPYYKSKEFTDAINFDADIAIIALGLNDTDPRNWPNYKDEFRADYQWLIDSLMHGNPKIKIYICKVSPIFSGHPRFKSGTRDWYWEIQDKIVQIAEANYLELIDLQAALGNRPELFADNLHPNLEGAKIIAKTVFEHLTGNFSGFKPDKVFASHMVLQRDVQIPIYGTANAGDQIEVELNQERRNTITDVNGKWKVEFPAMKFGGPYQIKLFAHQDTIVLNDVLIGDVWLCSGQSNMAFPLKSSLTGNQTLTALDKHLPIRLLKFTSLAETDNIAWDKQVLDSVNELKYFSGKWAQLDESSVAGFSAVAYYFAEEIVKHERIPLGLIQVAVGGSTQESWMDRKTLEQDDLLVDLLGNWRKSDFIQDWVRGRADVNLKYATNPRQRHPYEPAYNYEAGIAPLTPFPLKGVIWYQGESNTHNVALFEHEFPLLVSSWRNKWGINLPFYYVQLSSINRPSWPFFRDAQQKMQSAIPNVAMAVSSDLGDSLNVHPTRKKEVGERLALLALKNTYHRNIMSKGPVALKATHNKDTIVINFDNASQLKASDGLTLRGFEIEDNKGNQWVVNARISRDKVMINVPRGMIISRVLYAWRPFTRANLVNEASLPASTFSISIK